MAAEEYRQRVMVGLTINKPSNATHPITASLSIELGEGPDREIFIDLDEHQLAHLLGASMVTTTALVRENY